MTVEVVRIGQRSVVVMVDGKPHSIASAAPLLGMKHKTLERRIARGTRLDLPVQPRHRE